MAQRSVVLGAAALGVLATTALARATPGPGGDVIVVRGEVTAATSRWTADGGQIITLAEVRGDDGAVTDVSQLGGKVGRLAMRTIPGPRLLEVGMAVQLYARRGATDAGRAALSVDDVQVLREPRQGFVRTGPTPGGQYLRWESGCAQVGIAADGTRAISGDGERAVFEDVIATWNTGVAACSYMDLVSLGPIRDQEVGNDGTNLVVFRDVTWCRPAKGDDPPHCYAPTTAGVTTVTYIDSPGDSQDGVIVDADIELNGVDFAIAVDGVTLDDAVCEAELANTLIHELGHLLGFEHTCRVPDDPPRVDDHGAAVPLCSGTTNPDITEATMYPFQDCGETKKETLEQDDIDAVCAVYPIADDPMECKPAGDAGGCCAASDGPPPTATVLLGLAGLGLVLRRRRS